MMKVEEKQPEKKQRQKKAEERHERITLDFMKKIESKISELEKYSSVEFVPVLATRSSDYITFRSAVTVAFTFVLFVALTSLPGSLVLWNLVWSVGAGAFVASLLTFEPILRWVLPTALKRAEVEEAAHRAFMRQEVFSTHERTGVLIFISELEHGVFILADRGIGDRIASAEWATLSAQLAEDFNKRTPGDTFLAALQALSDRLAPDFPPSDDNPNEISDEVRIDTDTYH